ncbi:Serine protease snake [Eumeta japonica]|uniref:Serine protease snake n=1 Tax=Eumeta variegata TaxID=151549 RepID=A0A4C1XEC7_EUMVA|nr:Serine protease snake [Eumeta japonica]
MTLSVFDNKPKLLPVLVGSYVMCQVLLLLSDLRINQRAHALTTMNVCISVYAHLDNAQDSTVTETSQKQQGLCVLPPYPANGTYIVVNKPDAKPGDGLQAVYVTYSCGHGHALVGSKDVHCVNNAWTAQAPRCESEYFVCIQWRGELMSDTIDYLMDIEEGEASTSITNKETAPSMVLANLSSAWSYSGMEITPQDDILCVRDGQQGVCRVIADCESAKRELATNKQPQSSNFDVKDEPHSGRPVKDKINAILGKIVQDWRFSSCDIAEKDWSLMTKNGLLATGTLICSFKALEPVVCCFDDAPSAATPIPPGAAAVTTEKDPVSYDYEYTNNNEPSDGCEPIPARLTSARTGSKAWDKCIEYQNKYVYPCEKRLALGDPKVRMNYCGHDPDELHAGGTIKAGQFPHMVLLGFGDSTETARWLCGGTIISEKFVLTAGHCVRTIQYGEVKYIRTATLKRSDPLDPKRLFRVARILVHPNYNAPYGFNDIGLLESHTEILLDRLAIPACLPVGDSYNDSRAVAIGFGTSGFLEEPSDSLQKVSLNKFSTEDCSKIYAPTQHTVGFQESSQLCYGDKTNARDTCQFSPCGIKKLPKQHIGWQLFVAPINWGFEDFVYSSRLIWDVVGV